MKQKRTISALLLLLVCTALFLPVSAFAETSGHVWAGEDYKIALPEEVIYTFSPDVSFDDPSWVQAGIGDPVSMLEEYDEMNVVADFYTEGRAENVRVLSNTNNNIESMYDMKDLTEEERQSFLDSVDTENDEVQLEKSFVEIGGQPFYRIRIDSVSSMGEVHELQYGTVVNGHTLTVLAVSETELTEAQTALLEKIANGVEITQRVPKPEPAPLNVAVLVVTLVVLAAVIVAPIIYLPLRKRRDKREKAKAAEMISQYRQTHTDENSYGAVRFVNETECTREAVRTFSRYHAYGKNLPALLLEGGLYLLVLGATFFFDLTWWLKLIAAAMVAYFAYRAISMSGNIEKIQQKVFSRGVSSTARYTFFEEGFRVAGIQSASVFPYFQITAVKQHGHYLYLYYGFDNAYLIDQFGFSLGSYEEFSAFIAEKTKKEKQR